MTSLTCDDISHILPHLFLGNFRAASSPDTLHKHQITRVLSVLTLREVIPIKLRLETVNYKHVSKTDHPGEDLLLSLPECVDYISEAVQTKQSVLVHCQVGASRSATVVIAYVMRLNKWPLDQAYQFVKSHRFIINPNNGFRFQLRLYEKMACRLNPCNCEFRLYVLNMVAFRGNYAERFLTQLENYLRLMEELERAETRISKLTIDSVYRCAKCNKPVFFNLNILQVNEWSSPLFGFANDKEQDKFCNNHFIEPAVWMTATSTGANIFAEFPQRSTGHIPCPHCNVLIGKFTFHPFQTNLCNCPAHRGIITYVSFAVPKDAVLKKYTAKKTILAKLIGK